MTWTFWRCFSFIFGELSDCSCFLQSLAEMSRLLSVVLSLFLYKDMKSQLSKLTWFLHKKPRCVASGLQYSWGLWMARLSWFHLCLPLAPGVHYCGFQTLILLSTFVFWGLFLVPALKLQLRLKQKQKPGRERETCGKGQQVGLNLLFSAIKHRVAHPTELNRCL